MKQVFLHIDETRLVLVWQGLGKGGFGQMAKGMEHRAESMEKYSWQTTKDDRRQGF